MLSQDVLIQWYSCFCIGDNDTVVYLEEVPIQSLPAIKGEHVLISCSCVSFELEHVRVHAYMYVYLINSVCVYVDVLPFYML